MNNNTSIRPRTVKLLSSLIKPWVNEGIILVSEEIEIIKNLKSLAEKGSLAPVIAPKLVDQREAAEMLGLSHSNFKKLERENAFTFSRRMVGSSVRYRNTDLIEFIMSKTE